MSSTERRGARRILTQLRVEFRHLGHPDEGFRDLSRDLSAGGVFVNTSVGLELGARLELEITPAPGIKAIKMEAEVVRIEEEAPQVGSKRTGRTKGMALRFINSDPTELTRLLSFAQKMELETADGIHTAPGSGRKQ